MTIGKGSALIGAFVGAVVSGVLIGSHISDRGTTAMSTSAANQAPQASVENHATPPDQQQTPVSRRDAKPRTRAAARPRTPIGATERSVPAISPGLHERLKPLLKKGADMVVASEDFVDGEQFATVAHAARNTDIPFMVLKHRVLDEGKSLEDAIREFRPSTNAVVEAGRARAEAKSDIQAMLG